MNSKRSSSVVQLAVLIALILFTCGSVLAQDVTYNSAPGADFSKFKTYKWVKIEGAEYPDQILDQQIKQSIDSQLAAKGFTKTDSDTAYLYVGYQVSISQEKQWNAYGGGVGWRYRPRHGATIRRRCRSRTCVICITAMCCSTTFRTSRTRISKR